MKDIAYFLFCLISGFLANDGDQTELIDAGEEFSNPEKQIVKLNECPFQKRLFFLLDRRHAKKFAIGPFVAPFSLIAPFSFFAPFSLISPFSFFSPFSLISPFSFFAPFSLFAPFSFFAPLSFVSAYSFYAPLCYYAEKAFFN